MTTKSANWHKYKKAKAKAKPTVVNKPTQSMIAQETLMNKYAHHIEMPKSFLSLSISERARILVEFLGQHKYLLIQLSEQMLAYNFELAVAQDTPFARSEIAKAKAIWDVVSARDKAAQYLAIPMQVVIKAVDMLMSCHQKAYTHGTFATNNNVIYTDSLNCIKLLSFFSVVFD